MRAGFSGRIAKIVAAAFVGVAASAWLLVRHAEGGSPPAGPHAAGKPVVIELFSSEGCSSCPPADAYLAKLDGSQPIDDVSVIALEENVDYWDDLGWRDPFGRPEHGARQRQYATVLADHRVYTPEIVVDGHSVIEGGDEDQARRLIQESSREPKARVVLARAGSGISIDVSEVPPTASDDPAEVWLAITERGLVTEVARGENAGRRLVHAPIVRVLRPLGHAGSPTFHAQTALETDAAWKPSALRTVVFVQLERSRRIVGASAI